MSHGKLLSLPLAEIYVSYCFAKSLKVELDDITAPTVGVTLELCSLLTMPLVIRSMCYCCSMSILQSPVNLHEIDLYEFNYRHSLKKGNSSFYLQFHLLNTFLKEYETGE